MSSSLKHVLASLSALLLSSCSVWEDRVPCPCFVTLDYSQVDVDGLRSCMQDSLHWRVEYPDSIGGQGGAFPLDSLPSEQYLEVDKTRARLSCFCAPSAMYHPYSGLLIPEGQECPRIHAWTMCGDAGMTMRDTVVMHKLYARVEMRIVGLDVSASQFYVVGGVRGYDAAWHPVPGVFRHSVSPGSGGLCSFNLPRQVDGSLKILQYVGGTLVRDLAVGEYVRKSGYDWQADELEDFSIDVVCSESSARFAISQWRKSNSFTIVF